MRVRVERVGGFGWCVIDRNTGRRVAFFPVRESAREYSRWKNRAALASAREEPRIRPGCLGYHCSYCDEPCGMMGHRCDAAQAVIGEAQRIADEEAGS